MINDHSDDYTDDSLFNISSWGADMSFRELIQMFDEDELVRPEFQRYYVWKKNEASRFVESILLGLPVPSIFLANSRDNRKLIIDGYQRLMTVYDYVQRRKFGTEDTLFRLTNSDKINKRWRNKAFDELTPEDQRRLRSTTIHAIVFEQKQPLNDDTSMFQIFSRINTSGRSLNAQEIRNCVCQGPFNTLLLELNENGVWREMYVMPDRDPRRLDVELILRYFATRELRSRADVPKQINLRRYLDVFMQATKAESLSEKRDSFLRMVSFVREKFGSFAFTTSIDEPKDGRIKVNPLVFEALSVATDIFLNDSGIFSGLDFRVKRARLLENFEFRDASSTRTTDMVNIMKRINLAERIIFS